MNHYFIHREPLLDRNRGIAAYEVVFRKHLSADLLSRSKPSPVDGKVIAACSAEGGFERITGNRTTFLTVSTRDLDLNTIAFLPKRCVIQPSEQEGLGKEVRATCTMMKKQANCLLSVSYAPSQQDQSLFYHMADYIWVDVSTIDTDQIGAAVRLLQTVPAKLVAANVPDKEAFEVCDRLGFELFHGPFFMEPAVIMSEVISSSQALLIQLSNYLRENVEVAVVEDVFKRSPKLTFGLLNLINSAFFGVSHKIGSIRQAITLLGYENLQKWVILLLFTIDHRDNGTNPLIERAVLRGRIMELLGQKSAGKSMADPAFITGMLSLINVLFGVSTEEISAKLNLSPDIQAAMLKREGTLGTLLKVAESLDRQEYHAMESDLSSLDISVEDVLSAETQAVIEYQGSMGVQASAAAQQ